MGVIRWKRAGGSYSPWDWFRRSFSAFQARLCLPPSLLWKLVWQQTQLWKALISYLGRSSMHWDNNSYLILLCSLMSQLKGLVLPLAMGLAERIVCRLVNTGLWRSWSSFKMLVSSCRRSCMRTLAHIGCLLLLFCVKWQEFHTMVGKHHYTRSEICSSTYHIRHAKTKMWMMATQGSLCYWMFWYYSVAGLALSFNQWYIVKTSITSYQPRRESAL